VRAVLAVDVGSSGVRAALYDVRARPLRISEVRNRYALVTGGDGGSETDAEKLMRVVERSIGEALAGAPRVDVLGVGVSTFWHGLLGADEGGRPVTPLYLWSDTRAAADAERLRRRLDAEGVRQRNGCPVHATYWPAKLAWLRRERPELWRRRTLWLSFGDLLFMRLFGRLGTSLSMASGTGLFRLDEMAWDGALLRELRIDPESLPTISESERGLSTRHRRMWPRLAEVPWFHALGDGALANLGSGCTTPRRRALTIGTSAAVRVMHRAPGRSPIPPGLWRYRLDARRLITGGALSAGGNVREWLERSFSVNRGALERALRAAEPGSHGLTVLPHLAGERGPGYAPNALGAIAGLTLATSAMDVARAGVEAMTVEVARVNRMLDQGAPRAGVLVASGGAVLGSPAWMQLLADATGTPVGAGRAREASSRGAAVFALERLGLAPADAATTVASRWFRPRPESAAPFAAIEARQVALYRDLISEPHDLDPPT